MKFQSALMTAASGSIAGMTASRNRGGQYLRAKVIPVNPNTARQGEARANMAQAVGAWTNILTQTNRDAWSAYATGTPVVDALGASLVLSGQQMFIKSTLPRLIRGAAIVPAGPITAGLATTPVVTADPTFQEAGSLAATVSVTGAGSTGKLNVYVSEPTSPSRTLAHAKRAFALFSSSPTAGVFNVSIPQANLPYDYTEGQTMRVTFVFLDDDGRVSAEAFRDLVVEAAE
jgi:hypothetical protein